MMLKILFFIFFLESVVKEVIGNSIKIVGGHDVDIKQYPYQVSLVGMGVALLCGGSILSPDYVLTAAHCLWDLDPKYFQIRAGSSFYNTSGNIYDIFSFILHEKFTFIKPDYDVGLIKTKKMTINGVTTKAVQLAEAGSALQTGATIIVTGWGRPGDSGSPVVEESSLIQYGLVSWGGGFCNTTTVPDVYILVPAVRDWIKKHTGI